VDTRKKEMVAMKFVAVHESKKTVDCDISNKNRSSLPHVLVRRRTVPSRQQDNVRVQAGIDDNDTEDSGEEVSKSSLFNNVQVDTSMKEMGAMKFMAFRETEKTMDCDICWARENVVAGTVEVDSQQTPRSKSTGWRPWTTRCCGGTDTGYHRQGQKFT
jgi:hypothetical protein